MAVTPNLNLYKPDGSDYVSVDRDLNENYDKIDEAVGRNTDYVDNVQSDLGIVETTDVATHNIASGQYVIWKGALYTASSAITIGAELSADNLTRVENGLNVFNKLFNVEVYTNGYLTAYRMGKICMIAFTAAVGISAYGSAVVYTLPATMHPVTTVKAAYIHDVAKNAVTQIDTNGDISIIARDNALSGAVWGTGCATFICVGD